MNKQIEEIATILSQSGCVECIGCECYGINLPKNVDCDQMRLATEIYTAGYRKQSEGEWIAKDNFNGRCSIAVCSNCGTEKALAALATIETVTKAFPYCEKCGAKMKGENHIARSLTDKGYRKQEWISVEERLPDESDCYLVNIINHFGLDFVTFTYYTKNYGFCVSDVTHWMPLPEPPKKGDKTDA